jgi:hypothetical protein
VGHSERYKQRLVFNRAAINGGVGQVQFRAGNTSAYPNDDDLVSIEEQGRDTVYLIMRAEVTATTATTETIRVRVADPYPGVNISIGYVTNGVGTVAPTSPQTIVAASVTNDITTTGFVDFTVDRGTGSGKGRITFTATAAGRASDSDAVDIPPSRITGGGAAPTLSSPHAFWNGANSIAGTDTAGRVTLVSSASGVSQALGHQIKVTFAVPYASPPFVLLGPVEFNDGHFSVGTITANDFWIDAEAATILQFSGTKTNVIPYAVIG